MGSWLTYLDFLNSREKAILVWVVGLFLVVILKGHGLGVGGVLRTLPSKLLLLYGSALAYCLVVVALANKAGLWHTTATKATVYWFFGSGLGLVGMAVLTRPSDPAFLRNLFRRVVGVTIVAEFLVNLYVFPFLLELIFVPLTLAVLVMQLLAANDDAYRSIRPYVDGILGAIGLFLLTYVAVSAINDFAGFWSRENAENYLVAPALSLALLPFLYAVAWLSGWEQARLRNRHLRRSSLAYGEGAR